jgi:acyl-CoA reductase-like NAD-dependent aldehyde dehydrogenase
MPQVIKNPATLAALGEAPESSFDDIDRAVADARAAANSWHATSPPRRAALLEEIAGRIRAKARELAELSTRESGLARCESVDCVQAAAACLEFYAAHAASGAGPEDASAATPCVVAVLAPVNLALPVLAVSVARALACGWSAVCKPPAENPLTTLAFLRAFDGLPGGAVGVLTGGPLVGRALIAHPGVDRVMFTGSRAAGLEVAAAAAGKRLELEVGTIDAQIFCRDADLDLAVPAAAWTRLMGGGQGCVSGGHLYVERSMAAELVDRMHQYVGFLDVDDPYKPSTDLGPLISLDAARKLEDQVGRTLREGAKLILGGRRFRPSGLPGHFFQPTILADVRPGGVPMREQLLGPVITVTPVTGLAEALALCAEFAPRPALSPGVTSIYTGDVEAAWHAVEALDQGLFRINDPAIGDLGPFSGLRHPRIRHALVAYRNGAGDLRAKHVESACAIERKAWWFPYAARAHSP